MREYYNNSYELTSRIITAIVNAFRLKNTKI